ncbi:DUF6443 domain-containing protein [Flavobacterium anhuiense]|uniref:DUF6443 domain-containing protein n=1 Tax=Flavobacterium anhuiense TaxID=459526 RepID=UPI0034D95820
MKKKIYLVSAILAPLMVLAQTTTKNYIKSTTFQVQTTNGSVSADQKIESINYFDGLGRLSQRIDKQAGGQKEDLITPFAYDYFGREKRQYLPYARTSSSLNFEPALEADYYGDIYELDEFYANKYPEDFTTQYGRQGNAFSETFSEASPLSRIRKQSAPGASWVLNKFGDGNHNVQYEYYSNDGTTDNIKRFAVSFLNGNRETPNIEIQGTYSNLQLYKTLAKNENWTSGKNNTTEEFKDKEGRIILKRAYSDYKNSNGQIISSEVSHDTYYVYDIYGNLTYVIPPKAVDLLSEGTNVQANITSIATVTSQTPLHLTASNSIILTPDSNDTSKGFHAQAGSTFSATIVNTNETILNDLCYQYKYDSKNRLIEKKLPGKGWEYIVYDKLNRPLLTQDAILKTINKWMFTKYDGFGRQVYTGEYVNNSETSRNLIQALADASTFVFENRITSSLNINNVNTFYSNNVFPKNGIDLLTITYYDHYNDIDLDGATPVGIYDTAPKGLPVCTKTRVLGTSSWSTSVSYFDDKGRNIYTYNRNNFLDATNTVKTVFDFTGKTISATTNHQKGNNPVIKLLDNFTYDHSGRLLTQKQKINNQIEETIVSNTYDNLGHLITKIVGGIQTINYKYNVRGWLKSINDINNMGTDLFAFQINYDIPTDGSPLYNGNVSQTLWKTAHTDPSLKSYLYSYDALNRLTDAKDNLDRYNEKLSYDKNGNITTIFRNGNTILNSPNYGIIDNLTYNYDNGNRLLKVQDSSNSIEGFANGSSGNSIDYSYDANGNMKTDLNKGVTYVSYNYLNLPDQIDIQGNSINYTYDAAGVKQRKTANLIVTDYISGFQYENGDLKFFPQPEGYIKNNSGIYEYIYQYKDHLGNIRLSYNKNLNIIEESNYYPFGLKQKSHLETFNTLGSATAQKYKYNGKELQDELGFAMYDYGARNYDPALGRFMSIDRMTEKFESLTPYQYAGNTPTLFIDVNGEYIYIYDPNSSETYRYENGETQHQIDGKWKTIDANTILPDFILNTVAGLNSLENSGKTGKGLIDEFSGEKKDVFLKYSEGKNIADGNTIFIDPKSNEKTWTQSGFQESPFFVTLGHELGHVNDPTKINDSWYKDDVSRSEIRATHIENKIRSEAGLPLRTHYSSLFNKTTNTYSPNPLSTIIDSQGNSVYYNISGSRYLHSNTAAPKQMEASIRDGIRASGGVILNSRFNYNECH